MNHEHEVIKYIVQHPYNKSNDICLLRDLLSYIFSTDRDITPSELVKHFRNTEHALYLSKLSIEK